ncbi:MAG: DUF485 domain-containing protein [Pirellula sp.]|jgi:uncharacterized membrane protein (DUF485 family)|nr:DUF485 domain-containing protein [Pirellula sp.]
MHTSANQVDEESDEVIQRRQRIGLRLLLFFTLAYAGFIGLCTFAYTWISETRLSGIPLTVACGVGLILLSIAVAMVYGVWNRRAR